MESRAAARTVGHSFLLGSEAAWLLAFAALAMHRAANSMFVHLVILDSLAYFVLVSMNHAFISG